MSGPQILLTQQSASASFDFTATFTQAAAGWDATAGETYTSTATFAQVAATWAGVASEAFAATGSFVQAAAAWSAIANETSNLDFSTTFDQAAASWDASVTGPAAAEGGHRVGPVRIRRPEPVLIPAAEIAAAFTQPPAGWAASIAINDDDLALLLAA